MHAWKPARSGYVHKVHLGWHPTCEAARHRYMPNGADWVGGRSGTAETGSPEKGHLGWRPSFSRLTGMDSVLEGRRRLVGVVNTPEGRLQKSRGRGGEPQAVGSRAGLGPVEAIWDGAANGGPRKMAGTPLFARWRRRALLAVGCKTGWEQ